MTKGAARSIMEDCLFVAVIIIATFGLCGVLKPCSALAAEWRISPSMTVEGMYDDNYFKSEKNPTSVWGMQYAPAVEVEALTDRSRLDLNYKMGYFMYYGTRGAEGKVGPLDVSSEDYLGHDLCLLAATRFSTRLTTGIKEEYLLTREPGASDALSQIVTRDKYWRNRINPFASYDIGEKGEIKLAYRNEVLDYLDGAPGTRQNSIENRGIMTLTYNMNSTNHLDLDNEVWRREYSGTWNSYDSYQAELIYRRELCSWLTGNIGAGYQVRTFDENAQPDVNVPVYTIGLVGATDRTKLAFSFEHGPVDFTLDNDYFTAYRTNAFVQRLFFEDVIRVYAGGYYQLSSYEQSPRQDNEWSLRCGVGYSFWQKRMEISGEYNYTQRDSNQSGFSYTDNVIFVRLTSKWDFPKK